MKMQKVLLVINVPYFFVDFHVAFDDTHDYLHNEMKS